MAGTNPILSMAPESERPPADSRWAWPEHADGLTAIPEREQIRQGCQLTFTEDARDRLPENRCGDAGQALSQALSLTLLPFPLTC